MKEFCRTHVTRRLIFFVIVFAVAMFFLVVDYEKDYLVRRPFMGLLYRSRVAELRHDDLKSRYSPLNSLEDDKLAMQPDYQQVLVHRLDDKSDNESSASLGDEIALKLQADYIHKVTTVKPDDEKDSKEYTLELVQAKENYSLPIGESEENVTSSSENINRTVVEVKMGYAVYSEACQIPDVDPYHPTIRKLIATSPPLDCSKDFLPLTYARGNTLKINESAVDFWKKKNNLTSAEGDLSCCFHEVFRNHDGQSDNSVGVSKNCTRIADGDEMMVEFVKVICMVVGNSTKHLIYKNYHSFVFDKPKTEERCEEANKSDAANTTENYNILIIGADAMSRLNMHRQLKKTYKYLTESMGGIEMKGFNKVGDNTFPNLIPLLTGLDEKELPEICRNSSDPMDPCTIIWDRFSQAGYRTFYAEDTPHISTFNYIKPGFLKQPTDYYFRTIIHPMEDDVGRNKRLNCHLCVGSVSEAEAVLDYGQRFVHNFGRRKYFAMSWINSMSHDFLNSASAGDHFFANFFESLHKQADLDKTFVILMGDHGLRWGEIRETHIGRLEERLPMLLLVPPKNFSQKYPSLYKNLLSNANRLVTPFDLYATIQNVLRFDGNYTTVLPDAVSEDQRDIRSHFVKRAISLFSPVPSNRSCEDAAIAEAWCTCHKSEPVDVKDEEVVHVAQFLTQKINNLLVAQKECAQLKLRKVVKASLRTPKNKLHAEGRPMSNIFDYTVEIVTAPGGAKLEGTVRFVPYKHGHALLGDVSRLNLYGNQSSCISDAVLRKYCYCVKTKE